MHNKQPNKRQIIFLLGLRRDCMGWRIPSLFKSSNFLNHQLSHLTTVPHIHLVMATHINHINQILCIFMKIHKFNTVAPPVNINIVDPIVMANLYIHCGLFVCYLQIDTRPLDKQTLSLPLNRLWVEKKLRLLILNLAVHVNLQIMPTDSYLTALNRPNELD